jgi:hypothetical protein
MAPFKQTLPASLRSGSLTAREDLGHPASDRRPYLITIPTRKPATSPRQQALFPHESEDARITGSTRSLYRRLLALNLPRAEARIETHPELKREVRPLPIAVASPKIA